MKLRRLMSLFFAFSLTHNAFAMGDGSGELSLERERFMFWRQAPLPYTVSSEIPGDQNDTLMLKALLSKRLEQTYSGQMGPFPITIQDFVNKWVFVTLGANSFASPVIPGASQVPGLGEIISSVQIVFNAAAWREVPDTPSLAVFLAQGIEALVSKDVDYYVINPLAAVYKSVGRNVRGMVETHHLAIPTSLFNYVVPWFESELFWSIPNINLLPIWVTKPEVSAMPVDWMLAEAAFDLAVITLRYASEHPDKANTVYALYKRTAKLLEEAILPSNDIAGEDLEELLVTKKNNRGRSILVVSEYENVGAVDKLDALYELKEFLREQLTDEDEEAYQGLYKDGGYIGTFAQVFGGHMNCVYKDALYGSLYSEYYWLKGRKDLGKAEEQLDEEELMRLAKLERVVIEHGVRMERDRHDDYALTKSEKGRWRERRQFFNLETCLERYGNKLLVGNQSQIDVVGNPVGAYLTSLGKRIKAAQVKVQEYGNRLIQNNFDIYKTEGKVILEDE